jgi:hypothetical protein
MNERIQQLADEARLVTVSGQTRYALADEFEQRFAELIVLECSSICYKGLENGDEAASLLMNTFGVG